MLIEASAYGSALPRDRYNLKAPEAKGIRREDTKKGKNTRVTFKVGRFKSKLSAASCNCVILLLWTASSGY